MSTYSPRLGRVLRDLNVWHGWYGWHRQPPAAFAMFPADNSQGVWVYLENKEDSVNK